MKGIQMTDRIYYIAKGESLEIAEDWNRAEAALRAHGAEEREAG